MITLSFCREKNILGSWWELPSLADVEKTPCVCAHTHTCTHIHTRSCWGKGEMRPRVWIKELLYFSFSGNHFWIFLSKSNFTSLLPLIELVVQVPARKLMSETVTWMDVSIGLRFSPPDPFWVGPNPLHLNPSLVFFYWIPKEGKEGTHLQEF